MKGKLEAVIATVILLTGFVSANAQEKEADLPTLIHYARELRDILAADPYRPKYHFVPPEGFWNDVNGMIYWKGRYHLFYLSRTVDPELNTRLEKIKGQRPVMETWGHSSSIDLVHWIHHPFALVPAYDGSMPRGIYSGDMMDNMEVPTIIAHVPGQGTSIWQAEDDMLINWKPLPGNPVITKGNAPKEVNVFDVAGWQENGLYYALVGNKNNTPGYEGDSTSLFSSKDLKEWEYIGPFYKSNRKWTPEYYDAACIDFFPLKNRYMIVTHVHSPYVHSQYYLGSYESGQRFIPEQYGVFSTLGHIVGAPETMADDKGRRIMMAWNMGGMGGKDAVWKSMSILPRVLDLDEDGQLKQTPVEELQSLRYNHRAVDGVTTASDSELWDMHWSNAF
jgi:beta-fructofuranosidase